MAPETYDDDTRPPPRGDAGPLLSRDEHRREEPTVAADDESIYRLLVESVRDYAIFVLDPSGHVATWNTGAERIKGYTFEEIVGRHISTFYTDEDRRRRHPEYELQIASVEGRYQEEGWRVRKDGGLFWASVTITAIRDATGTLRGFAKVTRDLTERRKAEEELRRSEERFRLLVDSVVDYGVFMLDRDGRVASWNGGAERISGYTTAEILGRHFSIFYPDEDVARGKPDWELEVVQQEGRFEEEGWRVRKNGEIFWANVIITGLRDGTGELRGYAKVTRDLTERRESQLRSLEDARRLATVEASNRAKSEFLAAMSHELRTPLNAIGGYAELIALGVRGPVTPEQLDDLDRIRRSQQHLLGIINDLLNYSRIEAGQVAYDIAPVPVARLIEAVVPMIEPQTVAKQITFERDRSVGGLVVRADAPKVEQVLLNLLSNAVKFTDPGGRVSISAAALDGDRVVLRVSDTGQGIPADQQDAIFEPFVQLGRSLTSAHEGTGLGLAISRDLARAMGGDLGVESRVGAGSTFTLSLPRG